MTITRIAKTGMILAALAGAIWGKTSVCASPPETPAPHGKHVLVLGIDGCRSDALQVAETPNLQKLIDNGTVCYDAYVGGALNTKTEQQTSSGPGWASILTGVWVDKHQIPDNDFRNPNLKKVDNGKIGGYPHFFTRIKEKSPASYLASIVNWAPINAKILSDANYQDHGDDEQVARKCASLLAEHDPTVVFLQFDDVDHAGHASGFDPENLDYRNAIEATDRWIGQVIDAMKKRPNFADEDWLVLVTSDHGGIGKKHGGQSPQERTVFIIASGGGYPHKLLETTPGIVAILPTVLHHLQIPVDPAWGWEEKVFGTDQ